jgi:F-type H+-transporting ATPase subunit b
MADNIQTIVGLLIQSIPTVLIILFLFGFLNFMLFKPLARVLDEREKLTAGARQTAADSIKLAERKAKEYDAKLRDARAELYKEQEAERKRWVEEQAVQVAAARAAAEKQLAGAKAELAAETAAAKAALQAETTALADRIVASILRGKS